MQAIQNSIQEVKEWDKLVNEKPPTLVGWKKKPTFQKKAALTKTPKSTGLGEIAEEITNQLMKKPLNLSGEQRRKTKRSRLRFFSNDPKHALPLGGKAEQFDYCKLSSGQMSHSFLVVIKDPGDLVFF